MNRSLAVSQEKQITSIIPRYFVHLKSVLFLGLYLVRSGVYERDQVFFVAHGNRLAVRGPRDINIFAFRVYGGHAFCHSRVPNSHRFVATGGAQKVGVRLVPAQLIDRAAVAFKCCFLVLEN